MTESILQYNFIFQDLLLHKMKHFCFEILFCFEKILILTKIVECGSSNFFDTIFLKTNKNYEFPLSFYCFSNKCKKQIQIFYYSILKIEISKLSIFQINKFN